MTTCGTITLLLEQAKNGDKQAKDRLFEYVDAELKMIASKLIAAQTWRRGAFERTALVNDACERLLSKKKMFAENRKHFFFLIKRAMHDILVEQWRSECAEKNGGGHAQVPLSDYGMDTKSRTSNILDVNEALEELSKHDLGAAEIVALRFYCGLTLDEIAELTDRTLSSVRGDWDYARAWLHDRLSGYGESSNGS